MTLAPAVMVVTAVLTVAAFLVLSAQFGPGIVLYLAMLGSQAVWLLPVLLAQSVPPALLGGILLAAAAPDPDARPSARQALLATLLLTGATLYLVGWAVPLAFDRTATAIDRYRDTPPVEPAREMSPRPPAMDLLALVDDPSAPARTELRRRLTVVGTCLMFGAIGTVVVALRRRVTTSVALGVTAVAFIWQMQQWTASM